jgi:bifunctional DNase/RNase
MIRMEIETVVMGGMEMPSLIVLRSAEDEQVEAHLPIRVGPIEAASITTGVERSTGGRPLTHDVLCQVLRELGGWLSSVSIDDVQDTTFFATLHVERPDGTSVQIDCRPSDAIACAVRMSVAIYVRESVIQTATIPNFQQVEADQKQHELDAFHDFVEGLNPEDFDS